jgi:hypothetical protein
MPHSRLLKSLVFLGLCLSGCARTATVHYWKPAELDAPQVRRIAVAVMDGEHAAEVAVALRERLEADQPAESAGPAFGVETAAGEVSGNGGRKRFIVCNRDEADAVIEGQVLAYGAADKDRDGSLIETTGLSDDVATADESTNAPPGGDLRVRLAEVKIALQMVDASTGEVLASRSLERNQEWGVTARCRSPHDEEVLQELTSQCVDEFMTVLQPQRMQEEVELATGEWYELSGMRVRRGVRLARRGRWDDAERHWQAALGAAPDCDAALFNLAVAAAQREAYDEAEEYAMRALRLRHTPSYAIGLDQLRRFRADADRIERQMPPPIIAASHHAWDERPE